MSLEKLLEKGMIESIEPTKELVKNALSIAEKDLTTAETVLREACDFDWAFSIAYNSMLQAGRALMFSRGYRPAGEYKHLAVVKFSSEVMEKESKHLAELFDDMRKRRHRVIYEERGSVSESEVKNAIKRAGEFLKAVKAMIKE